jgi:hypothetical protein
MAVAQGRCARCVAAALALALVLCAQAPLGAGAARRTRARRSGPAARSSLAASAAARRLLQYEMEEPDNFKAMDKWACKTKAAPRGPNGTEPLFRADETDCTQRWVGGAAGA